MTFKIFMSEAGRQLLKWLANAVHVISLGLVRLWKIPAVQKALSTWGSKAIEIASDFVEQKMKDLKEKTDKEKK